MAEKGLAVLLQDFGENPSLTHAFRNASLAKCTIMIAASTHMHDGTMAGAICKSAMSCFI